MKLISKAIAVSVHIPNTTFRAISLYSSIDKVIAGIASVSVSGFVVSTVVISESPIIFGSDMVVVDS